LVGRYLGVDLIHPPLNGQTNINTYLNVVTAKKGVSVVSLEVDRPSKSDTVAVGGAYGFLSSICGVNPFERPVLQRIL
jgi:hypothetical protein